jgi:hypothetical protein
MEKQNVLTTSKQCGRVIPSRSKEPAMLEGVKE